MRASDLFPRRLTGMIAYTLQPNLEAPFDELPWYGPWLRRQVRSQPQRLLLCPPGEQLDEDSAFDGQFLPLWSKIRQQILLRDLRNIDAIAEALAAGDVPTSPEQAPEAAQSARDLVFSVVGWQTMLYKPDFSTYSTGGYTIESEMDGYSGEARVCLNQHGTSTGSNLADFLLGFGLMLPPRNHCGMSDPDDQALFGQTKVVVAKDLDAHVLTKVCGLRIQWVDSLSCHLELDRHSGTLYVFRYPSFCLATLRQHRSQEGSKGGGGGSVLHRCALPQQLGLGVPWASEEDVTELLLEVTLSYRLIFGQSKRSRMAFRKLRPFADLPSAEHDRVLGQLCGRKRPELPLDLVEREEYDLPGDFPHIRSKIIRLHGYAASRKPRSLRQLWRDKRDSTAWLAFWSVLIFGSVSILLAVVQIIFQILSYVNDIRGGGSQ